MFVIPDDKSVVQHTQKFSRDMKMAFRRTLDTILWTVNTESVRIVNASLVSEMSRVCMYNEEAHRDDEELVVDVKFTIIVPGKSLAEISEDWTLEMLTVAIEEKLRSKKCGENFSSFCEVSLLASGR